MEDDIAYYRIMEFFMLGLMVCVVGVGAESVPACRAGEQVFEHRCVCMVGGDCTQTPFHNVEIYACCAVIMVFLVANMATTLYYTRSTIQKLRELAHHPGLSKQDVMLSFSILHPVKE
jgi:hypothetical protein